MVNDYDMYRTPMPNYPVHPYYPPYNEIGYNEAMPFYPPPMHACLPYCMNMPNNLRTAPVANLPENIHDTNQTNPLLQQFLDENGQVDIQKMLQTVGQLADTVQQVSPVIKQVNDLIRAFRET